ncbi:MAG: TRAP transporter fused permease subunit [Pseudomonadota bacterium]|nr:TRAP transporter fused permease subunit [Pseudomonadota bacterium]
MFGLNINLLFIYIIGVLFSLSAIYTSTFGVFDEIYQRTITVGASVALSLLAFPLLEKIQPNWRLGKLFCWFVDAVLMGLITLSIFWFSQVYDELESGLYEFDSVDLTIAGGGLLAVVELTRRAFGMPLASLAVLCLIYALFGQDLPWIFAHAGYDLESTVRTVWYSFDGVFGFIVITVISLIFIFIVFGAVLEATGAGAVLLRIAVSLTGGLRGGPAHAAIAASGFFGTISGSVSANVVGTGVFTIPMIKERGFKNSFAGGVEAAASTGGQIMPPVMGAVAFVMADVTGISYLTIVCAALIPALFYYGSLFVAVWVEAARNNIEPIPKSERPTVSAADWRLSLMFVIPIFVIIGVLISGRSAAMAGLMATATGAILGLMNPEVRRKPSVYITALAKGGEQCARIMVAVAAIGIIVGVMNLTGLGIRFSNMILAFAGTELFFALCLVALACVVLGMGLPTIPAYLIIVLIMGQAIEQLGVPKLLVHLFVLYFGVLSAIIPPVAIAAYAAAPISGSNPIPTAFQALRLAFVGFLVPFMIIYNPSLTLVQGFELFPFVSAIVRLGLALWVMTTALGGVARHRLSMVSRIARFVLGLFLLIAHVELQIVGLVGLLCLFAYEAKKARKLDHSTVNEPH